MRRHRNSGASAEILVAQRFIDRGNIVSFPFSAKADYDLIADCDGSLIRVQVKTIYEGKTYNGIRWMIDFLKPKGMKIKIEKYTKEDCDYIVGACVNKNVCFVFPIEDILDKRQATFYFENDFHDNHMKIKANKWDNEYKEKWP